MTTGDAAVLTAGIDGSIEWVTPRMGLAGVCVGSAGFVDGVVAESIPPAPPLPTAAIIAARTLVVQTRRLIDLQVVDAAVAAYVYIGQ